jgi:hypothetical protein
VPLARLPDELLPLFAETNDLRRAVGRALWYLHRCLVFWMGREKPFAEMVSAWAPACADGFASMERRLRKVPPHAFDAPLRRYLATVLDRLGRDLERGSGMAVPFLRWLEARFPALTGLMKEGVEGERIQDVVLARDLRRVCQEVADARPEALPRVLLGAAEDLLRPE